MRRALITTLALAATLGLAACHTAKPAVQSFGHVIVQVPEAPADVAQRLQTEAMTNGHAVSMDGTGTVHVDFGIQTRRIPVPTEYGLWGTRVVFRNTSVASSAVYRVAAAPAGGSVITMYSNPTYWHPDIGVWLPGPYDVSPGAMMLDRFATQTYATDATSTGGSAVTYSMR